MKIIAPAKKGAKKSAKGKLQKRCRKSYFLTDEFFEEIYESTINKCWKIAILLQTGKSILPQLCTTQNSKRVTTTKYFFRAAC